MSIENDHISSVVANEFLEVYSNNGSVANYYVPLNGLSIEKFGGHLGLLRSNAREHYRKRGFSKASTDRLSLYFGKDYPSIIDFGPKAMSNLLNGRAIKTFKLTLTPLDKRQQRRLIHRFEFLCDNKINCIPLSRETSELAQKLLFQFAKKHELKTNFRNSLNDILILATTIEASGELVTKDSLLSKFIAEQGLIKIRRNEKWVCCDASKEPEHGKKRSLESKGFVNRSWLVKERRSQFVQNA